MLQRRFRPARAAGRRDGARRPVPPRRHLRRPRRRRGEPEEVERLELAFRRMLERLEAERRRTSSAALAAQEEERARVARDLHDEVNQSLTALLLRLEAARGQGAAGARARARRDEGARQPGDGGAPHARPPAPPDRARRPRPQGGARRPRRELGRRGEIERRASTSTATSPTSPTTSSWSSTGSPRRRSRTPPTTPAPSTSTVRLRARGRPGRADGRRRRLAASPSTRRRAASASPGMRERALLVGGDVRGGVAAGRRHAGRPHGAARPGRYRDERNGWKHSPQSGARADEGPDRRRPRDRALRPADAARAPDGHRGGRRGVRRRRGAGHGDPASGPTWRSST